MYRFKFRQFSQLLWPQITARCSTASNSIPITSPSPPPQPTKKPTTTIKNGPGLKEFLVAGKNLPVPSKQGETSPYLSSTDLLGNGRKVYFEVYGCQMNVSDTEIVWSILQHADYVKTEDIKEADVILVITCAVREGAESKIWNRLKHLAAMKRNRPAKKGPLQLGVLGCMAERLKTQLLEKEQLVDVVGGPDSYKDLPRLLAITKGGEQSAVNVLLSLEETYADVMPVRLNQDAVSAFVSIMRGCDNMCSYCIVPFTRGRERSRPIDSIENEVQKLSEIGVKEITLLGQNVNSYRDLSSDPDRIETTSNASGFKTVYKTKKGGKRFAELLHRIAEAAPEMRIRFTSPHPKDFPDEVLHAIHKYPNICNNLHLPAQSGSSTVLERMRRGYTRVAYLELVKHIRGIIPNVALSSDFICGFCGETDEEFADTITLIEEVKYNVAYLFAYSMREKTTAHRRFKDDVPQHIKIERLKQMVQTYRSSADVLQSQFVDQEQLILIEGKSKRSDLELFGRNDSNIKVIIPSLPIPMHHNAAHSLKKIEPGDFISVQINSSNSQVLKGSPLFHTTIEEFYLNHTQKNSAVNG